MSLNEATSWTSQVLRYTAAALAGLYTVSEQGRSREGTPQGALGNAFRLMRIEEVGISGSIAGVADL